MIAYFRIQNNLFMMIGAALGIGISAVCFQSLILPNAGYASAFIVGLAAFMGVIAGRLFSAWWSKRRLGELLAILYEEKKPEQFIEKFSPIVKKVPRNTAEYIDGNRHLAYAYEAMGEFDRGLELMNELNPENLKLHNLVCRALVTNQKMRLYLLKEDEEQAVKQLNQLRDLQETAQGRAPSVAESLSQCIRLAEAWMGALKGREEDVSYIQEEHSLANNWIHKKEMSELLERAAAGQCP